VRLHDLREFTRTAPSVDDEPTAAAGGMVMARRPGCRAVRRVSEGVAAGRDHPWRVLLTPQGPAAGRRQGAPVAGRGDLVLLCGRYEGIDERVRLAVVDEEISIGDYVLSGASCGHGADRGAVAGGAGVGGRAGR